VYITARALVPDVFVIPKTNKSLAKVQNYFTAHCFVSKNYQPFPLLAASIACFSSS
jgi:hypothetical protein